MSSRCTADTTVINYESVARHRKPINVGAARLYLHSRARKQRRRSSPLLEKHLRDGKCIMNGRTMNDNRVSSKLRPTTVVYWLTLPGIEPESRTWDQWLCSVSNEHFFHLPTYPRSLMDARDFAICLTWNLLPIVKRNNAIWKMYRVELVFCKFRSRLAQTPLFKSN